MFLSLGLFLENENLHYKVIGVQHFVSHRNDIIDNIDELEYSNNTVFRNLYIFNLMDQGFLC